MIACGVTRILFCQDISLNVGFQGAVERWLLFYLQIYLLCLLETKTYTSQRFFDIILIIFV